MRPRSAVLGWAGTHASSATGTFGGLVELPHGATKRLGVAWGTHAGGGIGTFGGVPFFDSSDGDDGDDDDGDDDGG
eukprot:5501103-Pyramimonas_sp.AAC.1